MGREQLGKSEDLIQPTHGQLNASLLFPYWKLLVLVEMERQLSNSIGGKSVFWKSNIQYEAPVKGSKEGWVVGQPLCWSQLIRTKE